MFSRYLFKHYLYIIISARLIEQLKLEICQANQFTYQTLLTNILINNNTRKKRVYMLCYADKYYFVMRFPSRQKSPRVYGSGNMASYTCKIVFLHLRVSALLLKIIIHFVQIDTLLFILINDVVYYYVRSCLQVIILE